MNYYEALSVLGLSERPTVTVVKQAFRQKALEHHPDKSTSDEGEWHNIRTAHDVLLDMFERQQREETTDSVSSSVGTAVKLHALLSNVTTLPHMTVDRDIALRRLDDHVGDKHRRETESVSHMNTREGHITFAALMDGCEASHQLPVEVTRLAMRCPTCKRVVGCMLLRRRKTLDCGCPPQAGTSGPRSRRQKRRRKDVDASYRGPSLTTTPTEAFLYAVHTMSAAAGDSVDVSAATTLARLPPDVMDIVAVHARVDDMCMFTSQGCVLTEKGQLFCQCHDRRLRRHLAEEDDE